MNDKKNIYLLVGLGNPGGKYRCNRHNVGFLFLEQFFSEVDFKKSTKFEAEVAEIDFCESKLLIAKPQTYMNESGRAVHKLISFYKIKPENVLVVYDDVDLPFTKIRVKFGGSHGGHNGIKSLISHLGSDFIRMKIGIGRSNDKPDMIDWVLGDFSASEKLELNHVFSKLGEVLDALVTLGVEKAQSRFN